MALFQNDLSRVWTDNFGGWAHSMRKRYVEAKRLELKYTDDIKALLDAQEASGSDADQLNRLRSNQGVSDPTIAELRQARKVCKDFIDWYEGTTVTATANIENKLAEIDDRVLS